MKSILIAAGAGLALLTVSLPGLPGADDKPAEPVNLSVNTEADEDDPCLSSSGFFLYYASNAKGHFDHLVSYRPAANRPWPRGREVEDYVNTTVDDRGVSLTRDGVYPQFLFFATKKDKEINNYDIYVAVKQGPRAVFTAPTPVQPVCTEADEMHPWLSADGRRLYFSRKTKDGWRVFVTSRQATTGAAGFGEPQLVADLPASFHHATLSPDGKTMYLQGPVENGRWGLFASTLDGKQWSKPEPLSINAAEGKVGDVSPNLSRDGSMLYFASDRPGGKGKLDLYVFPTAKLKKDK